MSAILAIDAAWTTSHPSGVALLRRINDIWHCQALAPSYDDFVALSTGAPIDWNARLIKGTAPDPEKLLDAAAELLNGQRVDLIPIDMPIATVQICGRRNADDEVSREFGRFGCPTHSPNRLRPGTVGRSLSTKLEYAGFPIATACVKAGAFPHLVEVYPHPTLLRLMNQNYRVRYKVSKSNKYWPGISKTMRIVQLLAIYSDILNALANCIQAIPLSLPSPTEVRSLAALKRYEDAIDALICAWAGVQYLSKQSRAFGDETAAIWIPENC